jgi:2-isopropylmalate synthase
LNTSDKIIIFDTTLRDGEQALRASLSAKQKLTIAQAITRLNVDVIELGFPASSKGDFSAIQQIAKTISNGPIMAGLARAVLSDIEACAQALAPAQRKRIHTFIATSPLHLQHKLRMTAQQAQANAVASIQYARQFTDDVEFSCEDASRTPIDDLCRFIEAAIAAGASTINLPDTVGYATPNEMAAMITSIRHRVPNIDKAILSVHCHNDLGLASANSLAAIQAGARQIECTINGIGERAGNCALEEVVMSLNTREDFYQVSHQIACQNIKRTSKLVSQICNMPIQANKAIVGDNAFSHSSGIHQDGVLKSSDTYEIMRPESIGVETHDFSITARSGRRMLQHRLSQLGYQSNEYDIDSFYADVMNMADRKGQLYDYDLEALITLSQTQLKQPKYKLCLLQTACNQDIGIKQGRATATVGITIGSEQKIQAATGEGPVEAALSAIFQLTNIALELEQYNLVAKGEGVDALGQVDIVVNYKQSRYHGTGLAPDVVEASVQAFIHVLNLIEQAQLVKSLRRRSSQTDLTTHSDQSNLVVDIVDCQ